MTPEPPPPNLTGFDAFGNDRLGSAASQLQIQRVRGGFIHAICLALKETVRALRRAVTCVLAAPLNRL